MQHTMQDGEHHAHHHAHLAGATSCLPGVGTQAHHHAL